MGAAFGGRDCVAVRLDHAVPRGCPVYRPFDRARRVELLAKLHLPGKGLVGIGRGPFKCFVEIVRQAAWKVKDRFGRGLAIVNGGFPADFDARKQVGL